MLNEENATTPPTYLVIAQRGDLFLCRREAGQSGVTQRLAAGVFEHDQQRVFIEGNFATVALCQCIIN